MRRFLFSFNDLDLFLGQSMLWTGISILLLLARICDLSRF
jgi:hypothetical protein